MRIPLLVCLTVAGLAAAVRPAACRPQVVPSDSLFHAAEADTAQPLRKRIALLKRALKADRDRPAVLHALGCLYMKQNTVFSRSLARNRLEEAVRLDPGNVRYRESYATLLRRQGFFYNSMEAFKKILKMDPDNAQAACELGEYQLQDMLKYVDARRFDGKGSMRSFGIESRDTAARYFEYALERDPYCRRAYYRLGFLYLECGHPEGLVSLSRALLRFYPGDAQGLLFLGLGEEKMGEEAAAAAAYRQALDRMGPQERAAMASPELIGMLADREERAAMGLDSPAGRSEAAVPAALLDRFWRRRDPLLLTPYNERKMAHYGRVAYANLRFSRPDEGVAGWQTDMGRIEIRYGHYLGRERSFDPYREVWYYGDFSISFYSYDSVHWWVDLLKDDRWVRGGYGRGDVFSANFPRRERYVDPYADEKYFLPCMVGQFKAPGDRVRLDLAWALPRGRLDYLKLYDTYQVSLQNGVFLLDGADEPVVRKVWRRDVLRDAWRDSVKSAYLLERSSATLEGGRYRLDVEVRDRAKASIGVFQDTLDVKPFGRTRLGVSSVVLATEVTEDDSGAVRITPNPVRAFGRTEPMYLYFEVYNLTRDAYGQTRYRVEYRIGTPALRRLPIRPDRAEKKRLGLEGKGWTISVASEYRGNRTDAPNHLSIDLRKLKPGLQLLTLVVTDERTGMKAGRETLFRILK